MIKVYIFIAVLILLTIGEGLRIYNFLDYGWRIAALEQRMDAMPVFTPYFGKPGESNAWEVSLPKDKLEEK